MNIKVEALTREGFVPYGQVISRERILPVDDGSEFSFELTSEGVEVGKSVCTGMLACKARPMVITRMEAHKNSSEVLVALRGNMILAVAAPDRFGKVKAFAFNEGDAVAMKVGTWHWIPYPVGKENSLVMVLFADKTGDDDLHIRKLDESVVIEL